MLPMGSIFYWAWILRGGLAFGNFQIRSFLRVAVLLRNKELMTG